MVDLDALRAELATSPWWIDGGMINRDLDAALAIIARHVSPQPVPDRAALVERMAEEILDRADYLPEGDWVDVSRLVCPDDEPDCDLEEVAEDWNVELVCWEYANDDFRDQARRMARAGLAAVEAAGWGPRPEAVTDEEITESGNRTSLSGSLSEHTRAMIVRDVLAALPERHRAIVLGGRGITVEGAK